MTTVGRNFVGGIGSRAYRGDMNDITETIRARRRLKRISDIRALFGYALGAAAALAVLGLVRLFSGQDDVFPTVIVPLLVLIGLAGDRLMRPRWLDAIEGVELAARNVVRTEAHATSGAEDTAS
jgi:peptidoglycan/LPS O-acetylase OafA/YrhL